MEPDIEPSTSVTTIRGLHHLKSVHPDLSLSFDFTQLPSSSASAMDDAPPSRSPSRPSSPHSALPSPSSPSGDSISSFPSVSSSFLFSSGPGSPPQPQGLHHDFDAEGVGLIIPSLALPSASRRPTPYGQTLGDVRLLLLAPRGADTAALVSQLLDENEDIVEVGTWEEEERGEGGGGGGMLAVLRASTDWVEHRDAHGLERVEPARNVEIVELPAYDPLDDVEAILGATLAVVHGPFCQVHEALNLDYAPDGVLASLLSSSCTPMYTALVLLQTSFPTPTEKALLGALGPHIPLVVLPPLFPHPYAHVYPAPFGPYSASTSSAAAARCGKVQPALSAFRPPTAVALRTGLFRSPATLALLRGEAAARFLRWREVERAVARVDAHADAPRRCTRRTMVQRRAWPGRTRWDKAAWEAQWEGTLSQDVAVQLRRRRAGTAVPPLRQPQMPERRASEAACDALPVSSAGALACSQVFDPLHVPSLVAFSFSLLAPLRARLFARFGLGRSQMVEKTEGASRRHGYGAGLVGLALVGAFCAGIGLGLLAAQV
ncbi:hypothetical protein B0H21DRAFT_79618 [Amylocystis lapponica]|nr:hypothetical protein B0H21DRAFT_79618 [Amylocystis lapponica]